MFMLEWGTLVPSPCYPTAAHNTRYVGRCTAELIRAVASVAAPDQQKPPLPRDLHVVGFSLGAQVAAFIANNLKPLVLPRITGEAN